MKLAKTVNALCGPAYFYLIVSVVVVLLLVAQNLLNGNPKELCFGAYSCNVTSVLLVFVVKALYVAFWTVVLDALCKYGLKRLSWVLVLFPFILFSVVFGLLVVEGKV